MVVDVQNRVLEIIAQQAMLELPDVSMDQTMEELGIDSLGLVESIFAIEEAFDVNVPFNANSPSDGSFDITSVATIVTAVQKLVAEKVT
jgi:acyl carrier protein